METNWIELLSAEFEIKYYNAGGVRTRVLEAGQGQPLIFLHGTGGHLEAYIRTIRAHADHFHVFAIDLVGHGFSGRLPGNYEIPAYIDHISEFMSAAGIRNAHLSGESLGGMIAAWMALRCPERVDRLVLNTAGGLRSDAAVMERIRSLTLAAVENPNRDTIRKRLEFLMADPSSVTEELVETRYRIYAQPGSVENMRRVLYLQEMEIRQKYIFSDEQLRSIRCPTLVLWTSHDPTAPPEVGRRFLEIPRSQWYLMEKCGHWPQVENAKEFNRVHIDFLNGYPAKRYKRKM
jgi:2-hydroxy-6-oxonona-2,4-dienedioate hydrolase